MPDPQLMRIIVKIPDCGVGNYQVEIDGKLQGMFKPGEEVVATSELMAEHSVGVQHRRGSWRQVLRPQAEQHEWNAVVPCDSLK